MRKIIQYLSITVYILLSVGNSYSEDNRIVSKLPRYIVCQNINECELMYDKLNILLDGKSEVGLRYFHVSIDKDGTTLDRNKGRDFIDKSIFLFHDVSDEDTNLTDYYEVIGDYWDIDKNQGNLSDVRELKKEYRNKLFELEYFPTECNLRYNDNTNGGTIVNDIPEIRYYVKSIRISNKTNDTRKKDLVSRSVVPLPILPIPFFSKNIGNISLDSVNRFILSSKVLRESPNGIEVIDSLISHNRPGQYSIVSDYDSRKPQKVEYHIDLLKRIKNQRVIKNWDYIFCSTQSKPKDDYYFYDEGLYKYGCSYIQKSFQGPHVPRETCSINTSYFTTYTSNDKILFPPFNPDGKTLKDSLHHGFIVFNFKDTLLSSIEYFNRYTSTRSDKDMMKIEYSKKLVKHLNDKIGKPDIFKSWSSIWGELITYVYKFGDTRILLVGKGKGVYSNERKLSFRVDKVIIEK